MTYRYLQVHTEPAKEPAIMCHQKLTAYIIKQCTVLNYAMFHRVSGADQCYAMVYVRGCSMLFDHILMALY